MCSVANPAETARRKATSCRLVGDVGHKGHHADTGRRLGQGQRLGLGQAGGGQVTGGDVTSLAGQLAHQFSADARTAAGDHRDPSLESLHPGTPFDGLLAP